MNINVWSGFSKRINSTKQPTGGTQKTVYLKEETDIESPTFILDSLDFSINYVEAFGHYYFAHCRNLDGHRTEIICDIDLMATYKTNISGYTGFVEYAASSSNVLITDPRNKPTYDLVGAQTLFNVAWDIDTGDGVYIVGVISSAAGAVGTTDYYAMSKAQLIAFCNEVFSSNVITDLINDFQGVQNSFVSCIWLPFTVSFVTSNFTTGSTDQIEIGRKTLTSVGYKIRSRKKSSYISGSLSWPVGYTTKTYLHHAPYSTGVLYLPFVGCVDLDLDILGTDDSLGITYDLDVLTGDIIYHLNDAAFSGFTANMATYSGNCATKVPVSGASVDGIGVGAGVMGVIGGIAAVAIAAANPGAGAAVEAAAKKGISAGLAAAAAGAAAAARSMILHTQTNGAMSSAIGALSFSTAKAVIFMSVPAETNLTAYRAEQGMPYFKTVTLSSLSGFIKCSDASVDCAADEAEKQTINGYLNSGFYLE